jgi:hypothetical protein
MQTLISKTMQHYLAFGLLALFISGSTQAATATYNYTILGDVSFGDGTNAYGLMTGDVVSATGTFTADLGANLTGTVNFGAGDTMLIDLLGGTFTEADDASGGPSLTFDNGSLTDFVFFDALFTFNSNFTSFDDGIGSSMFGDWRTAVSITEVPVPAAAWLFGSALLGFAGLRRKQR